MHQKFQCNKNSCLILLQFIYLTAWCAKVLNCGFGRVAQRATRMKDSVIEDLKRRIYKIEAQIESTIYKLHRQMTALQVEFQQRDEELNQKIDRIAAVID